MEIKDYFRIEELVPPDVFKELGEEACWKLFDKRLLDTIVFIRRKLDRVVTINNWVWDGEFKYRGYRPKNCAIGAPKSQHKLGTAIDFDVKGMTADMVRKWIDNNSDLLPHNIRIETGVSWVHIDIKDMGVKVFKFKP